MKKTISDLSPADFENLTFDLMQSAGLQNLVWRTPGADGGRDIEGLFHFNDLSGSVTVQKWYVECKRYTNSIDWPTVWEKLSYADSLEADYLLLVTNNNPSPSCETQISTWNSQRRMVKVRVWRGYQMEKILLAYPAVAAKYGLRPTGDNIDTEFLPVLIDIMKVAQASYTAFELGSDPGPGLVVAAALTELVSMRMDQLRNIGRMIPGERSSAPPDYDWLNWSGPFALWETVGLRALLSAYKYVLGAKRVNVLSTGSEARVSPEEPRGRLTPAVRATLTNISLWSSVEIGGFDDATSAISIRSR